MPLQVKVHPSLLFGDQSDHSLNIYVSYLTRLQPKPVPKEGWEDLFTQIGADPLPHLFKVQGFETQPFGDVQIQNEHQYKSNLVD